MIPKPFNHVDLGPQDVGEGVWAVVLYFDRRKDREAFKREMAEWLARENAN